MLVIADRPIAPLEQTIRVLLVQGEDQEAALATALLTHPDATRFVIDWASTYADALTRAATGAYDVLVIEESLHGRSGAALLTQLRTMGTQTPALLLTAGRPGETPRVIRSGTECYIPRALGWVGDTLVQELLGLLERRRFVDALVQANDEVAQLQGTHASVQRAVALGQRAWHLVRARFAEAVQTLAVEGGASFVAPRRVPPTPTRSPIC